GPGGGGAEEPGAGRGRGGDGMTPEPAGEAGPGPGGAGGDGVSAEVGAQVRGEFGRGGGPPRAVTLRRLEDDGVEVAGDLGADAAGAGEIAPGREGVGRGREVLRAQGPAAEQFVEDGAEGVDVGAGVDAVRVGGALLGAHVA